MPPAPQEPLARRAPAGMDAAQGQGQNVELVSQIGGSTYAVAVRGNTAYLGVGSWLVILDVSDPANPREVGFYDTPGEARGVAVAGAYAYVAAGDGGLVILRFALYRLHLPLVLRSQP